MRKNKAAISCYLRNFLAGTRGLTAPVKEADRLQADEMADEILKLLENTEPSRFADAKKTAETLSGFINVMGNRIEDLVEHMAQDHRTLQQGFTRLAVAWLVRCAKMHDDGDFDGRNEVSAKLGKKFVERVSESERAVPFI